MVENIVMKVDSSAIEMVKYDRKSENLNITFTSGGSYDYPNVPEEVVIGLINASSAGKYYHQFIKPYAVKEFRNV